MSLCLQVFVHLVKPLVDGVLAGVPGALLCLGAEQSGKSFSLFGNGIQSGILKRVRIATRCQSFIMS
jgi:hypothetical protein